MLLMTLPTRGVTPMQTAHRGACIIPSSVGSAKVSGLGQGTTRMICPTLFWHIKSSSDGSRDSLRTPRAVNPEETASLTPMSVESLMS